MHDRLAFVTIKFIQINIYGGKYFDDLLPFLKAENPDFISMQEVTSNDLNLYSDKKVSLFEQIKSELDLNGVYCPNSSLVDDPSSQYGIAVFARFPITNSNVLALKKFRPLTFEEVLGSDTKTSEVQATNLLDITVQVDSKPVHIISWHGAWTAPPHDTEETLRQAKMVKDYLGALGESFILGGDLNNIMGNQTIDMLSGAAQNLMINSGVEATTNRKVHKIRPRGYLIDYIFTSRDIVLKKLEVPEITVSDHLPVIAGLEI